MASGSSDKSSQGTASSPVLSNLGIVNLLPPDTSQPAVGNGPSEEVASTSSQVPAEKEAPKCYWDMYPHTTDEPTVFVKLSSPQGYAEMSGWSGLLPLRLFNTGLSDPEKSKFSEMTDENGSVKAHVEPMLKRRVSLKELETYVKANKKNVKRPVHVQVIAKRKVEMHVKNRRVSLIPTIIIRDMSGYCILTSTDEGVGTVYNGVDVGDFLMISTCTVFAPQRCCHRGLFSNAMFLNVGLKIPSDTVHEHYIRKFSHNLCPYFQLPESLFDMDCPLKTPTMLQKEFQNASPPAPVVMGPPVVEKYFDIVGVVVYVGRVERARLKNSMNVDCLVGNDVKSRHYFPYEAYRWIHIVDKTSKPLPVKVFVNNLTLGQDTLIPGTILVISHCQTEETVYVTNYCKTSCFSQLFPGLAITKYFMLHPNAYNRHMCEVVSRANYTAIITRKDIVPSVGASHPLQITDPNQFHHFYMDAEFNRTFEAESLVRRESQRLYIRGMVYRVVHFIEDDLYEVNYQRGPMTASYAQENFGFKVIENFHPDDEDNLGSSWYSFIRKLPDIDPSVLEEKRSEDIMQKIVDGYREYCSPLLMPARCVEKKKMPKVSLLEAMDGAPYYMVEIVNNIKKEWFRCIYKSCTVPHEELWERLKKARGKNILGVVDIFCLERDTPLEVQLQDFVVDTCSTTCKVSLPGTELES